MVEKAEPVRQVSVPEDDRRVLSIGSYAIRPIQLGRPMPGHVRGFERSSQDAFVGGEPAETDTAKERNQFGADRPFGRPKTGRRPAKHVQMAFDGQAQLGLDIVRCSES
jgi:hypothetical protein